MSVFCRPAACYGARELLQTPEQGPPRNETTALPMHFRAVVDRNDLAIDLRRPIGCQREEASWPCDGIDFEPELASRHAAALPLHHRSDEFLIDRAFFQPPVCDRPSGSTRRWRHIPPRDCWQVQGLSPSLTRRPAICRCESSRISKRLRGHHRPRAVGSIPTLAVEPDTAMMLPSSPQLSVSDAGCSPSGFWMSVIPNASILAACCGP
jgi:hypothetical protein